MKLLAKLEIQFDYEAKAYKTMLEQHIILLHVFSRSVVL